MGEGVGWGAQAQWLLLTTSNTPLKHNFPLFYDSCRWEKVSGEERGANGFWKRWTTLRGASEGGVEWEETWWQASDWSGLKVGGF